MADPIIQPIQFALPSIPGVRVFVDSTSAEGGVGGVSSKFLILGQKLAAGTATAGEPIEVERGAASALFGAKSQLRLSVEAAEKAAGTAQIYALPMDQTTGTAAKFNITLIGAATATGTLTFWIGDARVQIAVSENDTAAQATAALKAALDVADLPLASAAIDSGNGHIVCTLAFKGKIGNQFQASQGEGLVPGITATVSETLGGTLTPDAATIVAALGDDFWTEISNPWQELTIINAMKDEAERRNEPAVAQAFFVIQARIGSLADHKSFGETRNSAFEVFLGVKAARTPSFSLGAITAMKISRWNLAAIAFPIQNANDALTARLDGAQITQNFTNAEKDQMFFDAHIGYLQNRNGEAWIWRLRTTYNKNSANVASKVFRDVADVNNLRSLRHWLMDVFASKFSSTKIGDDADKPKAGVTRPRDVFAAADAWYQDAIDAGRVTNLSVFREGSSFAQDKNEPDRINGVISVKLVAQLRQVGLRLKLKSTT